MKNIHIGGFAIRVTLASLLTATTLPAFCQTVQGAGTARIVELTQALLNAEKSGVKPEAAVSTGLASAQAGVTQIAGVKASAAVTADIQKQSGNWLQLAKEAYVAAVPGKDRARARSLMIGNGTDPESKGRLYYFVSRSMPSSLLQAYALDAFNTGSNLVIKGLRKGDTLKDYVQEMMDEYNSADGQLLAGLEINPNLFDMFDVQMVPAVVWTNKMELDEVGSGCQNLPEGVAPPQLSLPGPDDSIVTVDKPVCAPVNPETYYKMTGALKTAYVLEQFQSAGAPAAAIAHFKQLLAGRNALVPDTAFSQPLGNAMPTVVTELKLGTVPPNVLKNWAVDLKTLNVRRSPYGPAFSPEVSDDPVYRKELLDQIAKGLSR